MTDDKKPVNHPEESNLIPFPKERIKKKRQAKAIAGKMPGKKVTLFLSILAVMVTAVLIKRQDQQAGREVANESGFVRDNEMEKLLALELSGADVRGPASFGREPDSDDRLRSGELHSRYQVVYAEGKIVGISLYKGAGVLNDPIYIDDRKIFLERYKNIIAPGYDSVEAQIDTQGNLSKESYILKRDNLPVGLALFELDRSGAFHSLKVQVGSDLSHKN
jgi:hypothetical protein